MPGAKANARVVIVGAGPVGMVCALALNRSGIAICVTPPPRLPQPAAAAFAVPTIFGANITEV